MYVMSTRTEAKISYLKEIFNGSDELTRDLERFTHMQEMNKGQLIAGPNINCDKIYILTKGSVNIYYVYDGKKIIVDTLMAGDVFGDMNNNTEGNGGKCDDAPFLEAREDIVVCVSLKNDLYRILQRYPELAIKVLQKVSGRLSRAERKIQDLALRTVSERIVRELARLAEVGGENYVDRMEISGAITHEQLAMIVGATRETVTKALTSLRQRGIVVVRENKYIIHKQMSQPRFSNATKNLVKVSM